LSRVKYTSQQGTHSVESKEMDNAIQKLLSMKAVEKCVSETNEFISPIFLVPKKDGSQRFIFNLKKLNQFVGNDHFKMEDLRSAINLMFPECYFTSIDLKDAYYAIPIHPSSRKYLKFQYRSELFQFTCLPFGLSCAPRIFTKVLKPVVKYFRKLGILLVIYLDDLLLISSSIAQANMHTKAVVDTL